nr:uncharacterized protein [Tanacetum cinerariifolium]
MTNETNMIAPVNVTGCASCGSIETFILLVSQLCSELFGERFVQRVLQDHDYQRFIGVIEAQVLLHEIHAEVMNLSEFLQVAAMIEKLPPSWVEFKNYLKQKRKEMGVEDLVFRLCIEEDNKLTHKKTYTSDSAKANMVEHAGSSSKSYSKAKGKGKWKNDKKGKGKAEYLAPKARIIKQKFQGTCYKCDQLGHRAANCKMPKRVNPHQANMVNDNMDMITMVSHVIAMISKVDRVVCKKGKDSDVMLIELIKDDEYPSEEELDENDDVIAEEEFKDHFDKFPTRSELAYHKKDSKSPSGINNFTGRVRGMPIFVGNFTYVLDFMIVEDISSVIDPRISPVVLGKPFVELSNMTYDSSLGVVNLTKEVDKIAYKMPHTIEKYDSFSNEEKENIKSMYVRNEENKRKRVEYVRSKILGFYKECLELGPEYQTGQEESSNGSSENQRGVT